VQSLCRDELGRQRERRGYSGSLLGCANHSTSLVVVFGALDVDVVIVVLDAVFLIDFFVQLVAQLREDPTLEDNSVDERNKDHIEDDLPEHFTDDVSWIECNSDDFIPEGHLFFGVSGFCKVIDYHSQTLTQMRTVRNN
jgi:hypothetical protein